jgi:hypothetical protein
MGNEQSSNSGDGDAEARANAAADSAEASARIAYGSSKQADSDANKISGSLSYTGRIARRAEQQLEQTQNSASRARLQQSNASQSATGANIELQNTIAYAKQTSLNNDDSKDYADSAEKQAEFALKQSSQAQKEASKAGISAIDADDSAISASRHLGETETDLSKVKSIINTLSYTGFNAGEIFLKERSLNQRYDIINNLDKKAIELHLYQFKIEKDDYLEKINLNNKVNIINDMFLYMIDYYMKYNKSYYDDSNTTLLFLNYIINKSGYNKSGLQTKEYELYTSSVALKQKLFPMENFTNMSNITNSANNILSKIKHSFTNIIEGNTPMGGPQREEYTNPSDFIDIIRNILSNDVDTISKQKQELQTNINYIKRFQDGEFLAQRDTIMNNVLMDYMINNKEGSNIEQVYEKLNQEKNDKLRKTKIAAYYTKSFKEYIYLLKIVIFSIVLMIPILIFNRLEILDKSLTLILVVTIITLGFLYLSYRLYILYMRDSKDFDKFKIPFTRTEAANLKSKGSRYSKDSPLKSLGITCIGEECCDASMVYDKLRDKCVATENFGNYFENAQELNNQQKNIIKENNSHEDKSNFAFLGGNANVIENFRSLEGLKQRLLLDSLNNSSERTF